MRRPPGHEATRDDVNLIEDVRVAGLVHGKCEEIRGVAIEAGRPGEPDLDRYVEGRAGGAKDVDGSHEIGVCDRGMR